MIDEAKLIEKLEAKITEITDTIPDVRDEKPLVAILQSTRARVLMDMVDIIKSCVTVDKSTSSWEGQVDRQSGAFDESEIRNSTTWR